MTNEWISVEDRLPELCESGIYDEYNVFVSRSGDSIVTTLDFTEHGWTDGVSLHNWDGWVTHWQPLPEPPEV